DALSAASQWGVTDPLPAGELSSLDEQLNTIEDLLVQFSNRTSGRSSESVPRELFHHYTRLIEADVPEQHARGVVLELHRQAQSAQDAASEDSAQRLSRLIESQICGCGPSTVEAGTRMCVGV